MRIDPEIVTALGWYFSNGAESVMGLRSNFNSMVMQLKLCGAGNHNTVPDVEEKWISAASRSRAIRNALEKCTTDQRVALRAAFLDPRHVEPFGIATGIAPLTDAAHSAWIASGTNRTLTEWLYRLARRCVENRGNPTIQDRETIQAVQDQANLILLQAVKTFRNALGTKLRGTIFKPRQYERKPMKLWYTVREISEQTGLPRKTVLRMLRTNNVKTFPEAPKRGQMVRVSLTAIERGMPDLVRDVSIR